MENSSEQFNEIQHIFTNFINNFNEMENIRKEILNYQKQFKPRLNQLKNENKEYEKKLLEYLESNQLPGIRSGDFLLLADEKPIPNNKEMKEKKIQSVLLNNQIDTTSKVYRDILEVVLNNKSCEKMEKRIKCKKYNNDEK
jgi:hypothetical protein